MVDVVTDPMADEPEALIPEGPYCYEMSSPRFRCCPFWRPGRYSPDGLCSYLQIGHDDFPVIDQLKSCEVNRELERDTYELWIPSEEDYESLA